MSAVSSFWDSGRMEAIKRLFAPIGALISLSIVCLALWVLYRTLHAIQLTDVVHHFRQLPASSIPRAVLVTAASYLIVTGYDVVALNHIERPQPYPRAALAAFLASAFGNNIGFGLLTGGSVRYRVYAPAGLSTLEIAGVTAMCSFTSMLGMGFVLAVSLLLGTDELAEKAFPASYVLRQALGSTMLVLLAAYIAYTAIRPLTIRTQNWSLKLPSADTALTQLSLATIDIVLVGSLIYVLLPPFAETNFFSFLGVFALALIAGSMSNVPGGIGVFETVLLVGLPHIPPAALLGSIVLFRCVYYLAPLMLAAVLLAAHEMILQRPRLTKLHLTTLDWLAELGPQVMAMLIVFAGIVLLFSGAIPSVDGRMAVLSSFVPLWVIELTHVTGSVAGVGLIVLARGLARRLAAAYDFTATLLGLGIILSLIKGFDYHEAIILALILAILLPTRMEFLKEGSVVKQGFSVEWLSTLTAILAITIWLGLFSYKGADYSGDLWLRFSYDGDYARFLRSTLVAVLVVTALVSFAKLARPEPRPQPASEGELQRIRAIVKEEPDTRGNLALLGDKRLLFSDSGKAFIMYQVQGRSWVSLGDPVGPPEEHDQLLLAYTNMCDRHGGWPVFYLVDADKLIRYIDLGLSLVKLGDEARVELQGFRLEHGVSPDLLQAHADLCQQGARCDIINSYRVPAVLPELKRISDQWLASTQSRERGFAKGFFDADYVSNFPCALLRVNGHIAAFAVLWASANKDELALDLMRYATDAPKHALDFMIIELILGGWNRGYRWFNLGTAPLASLQTHPLAPLWQRVGKLMFRQSEHFRDIESLRRYEEKLSPVWRPKYLASPGGLNTPRILRDVARLIARPPLTTKALSLDQPDPQPSS
ncbi:MAG: bifunctional lysylphosphatidylglycerol flippase/synthetase MprF [Gammaproteobacteria bacterium]